MKAFATMVIGYNMNSAIDRTFEEETIMKRILLIMILILYSISLLGCSNNDASEAKENGKLELQNKEYNKALSSFNYAKDKGSNDEEVKKLIEMINDFYIGKKLIDQGSFKEAQKVLDEINKDYVNYSIKTDIDDLKLDLVTYKENNEFINNEISSIEQLMSDSNYTDAKTKANNLLIYERVISKSKIEKVNTCIQIADAKLSKIEKDRFEMQK